MSCIIASYTDFAAGVLRGNDKISIDDEITYPMR